jgi:hypothetical protein
VQDFLNFCFVNLMTDEHGLFAVSSPKILFSGRGLYQTWSVFEKGGCTYMV